MPEHQQKILVTGASGHLGRLVVQHLLDGGIRGIVAASRNPESLAEFTAKGVEVRQADFDDPAILDLAFAGVDRVLIISAPDTPNDPPRRLRQHLAAVDAAIKAGVGHIVYTSMLHPEPGSPIAFAHDHYETEQAIEKSGIAFTILRPCWYTDSVFMWLPQVLKSNVWHTAAGDGRTAYVWRDDLARTAAAALKDTGLESRRLDVTGPEALTSSEIAEVVNDVLGSSVELALLGEAERKKELEGVGLPPVVADLFVSFEINTRQGRLNVISDTVGRLTGEPPRSLRQYLSENRDALVAAANQAG
ncbi:NAD(P)-dependent oxidoreductase [Pectobacterium carotovorum subsp. carotovorum]|nr:NAD(P)-dependent oxidoreductase [Pectobacterium carotovorum subsp. carotovorum]